MENNHDEKLGFLGLLYVAHKALIGEELLENFSKVKLLLMASDATSHQAQGLERKASLAHLPFLKEYTEEELGRALGHETITFIGIIDAKAAGAYLKKTTKKESA